MYQRKYLLRPAPVETTAVAHHQKKSCSVRSSPCNIVERICLLLDYFLGENFLVILHYLDDICPRFQVLPKLHRIAVGIEGPK